MFSISGPPTSLLVRILPGTLFLSLSGVGVLGQELVALFYFLGTISLVLLIKPCQQYQPSLQL